MIVLFKNLKKGGCRSPWYVLSHCSKLWFKKVYNFWSYIYLVLLITFITESIPSHPLFIRRGRTYPYSVAYPLWRWRGSNPRVLYSLNLSMNFGCGEGRIRTCDLRDMSPTSCQLLYLTIFL